jgi:four helix bundle protein
MVQKTNSYKDLVVWQKAHKLVLNIYRISQKFPKEELYGLTSQIRRAAVSIPANIAEGYGRKGTKDKLRFYNISLASLNEVNYYLILINDLKYEETSEFIMDVEEIGKMLKSYSDKISKNYSNS